MNHQRTALILFMLVTFFAAVIALSAPLEVKAESADQIIAQATATEDDLLIPLVSDTPAPNATLSDDDVVAPLETMIADQSASLTATNDPCYIDGNAEYIPYCTWTPTPTNTYTPTPKATEQTLPVEGLYAYRFEPRTESGDCSDYVGGDNDGPSREYDPMDPMFQTSLCKWDEQGIVLLNNETFRWDGNAYSTGVSIDTFDNSSRSRVISIIGENSFDVILTDQSGACTHTYVIHYELVQAGELYGCFSAPPTEEAEVTPEATLAPVETVEPPVVEEGRYVIQWLPYSNHCDTEYAPTFTEVPLSKRGEDTIRLYINGQVVEFGSSYGGGEYSMYGDTMFGTLKRRFVKDFNIELNQSSEDKSKSCYSVGIMTWVSGLTEEDKTALGGGGSAGSDVAAGGEGSYSATWEIMEGSCVAELEQFLPNFASATVRTEGGNLVIEADGQTYTMAETEGMYYYFGQTGDVSTMLMIYALEPGQDIVATYGHIVGEQACYAEVTLKP